jgi:hypothetical protein
MFQKNRIHNVILWREKIMKKRFKNILIKKGKKSGICILICAVILTISLGTLVGCATTEQPAGKENTGNNRIQNASGQPEEKTVQTGQMPDKDSANEDDTLKNTTMLTFSKVAAVDFGFN